MRRPLIIGVGGFTSNVGKTTVMCELLREFPGWEAIKTTRGHYRSCGKDPVACCVSHLLSDQPLIFSERFITDIAHKDTGRFWEAGASNVHWLIATDSQVEKGIILALERVVAEGVFIEGNSFTQFVQPDYFLMVKKKGFEQIKASAKKALEQTAAIFESEHESLEKPATSVGIDGRRIYGRLKPELLNDIRLALSLPRYQIDGSGYSCEGD